MLTRVMEKKVSQLCLCSKLLARNGMRQALNLETFRTIKTLNGLYNLTHWVIRLLKS